MHTKVFPPVLSLCSKTEEGDIIVVSEILLEESALLDDPRQMRGSEPIPKE